MNAVSPPRPVPSGTPRSALEALPVRGRAARDNYDRAAFGQAWLDVDRNGCDTRNDILRRDLADPRFTDGSRCRVAAGPSRTPIPAASSTSAAGPKAARPCRSTTSWHSATPGRRAPSSSPPQQRGTLANDPLNLIAADGPANQDKSASDAATWLPPNKAFRCHYVARQISVKAAYQLWVTAAEKEAMKRILTSCPEQQTIVP